MTKTPTGEPTGDMRERIAEALHCPTCGVEPGAHCLRARVDNRHPHMTRVREADAVMPVVEAETADLRAQLDQARDAIADERKGRLAAEAAVRRVRGLHRRNANTGTCEHCSERDYPDYAVPHPCPTIAALDAEQPKERDDPFATGTRYRDSHGEVWTVGSNGLMHHHSYSQRGMDAVRSEYGPLTRIEEPR